MSIGSRVFIALIFLALGVSFIVTTGTLYYEFQDSKWFSLAVFYSHLFVFFPTFGLVALWAFYIPASVFTDMYWHHTKWGKVRFFLGFLIVAGVSYLIAQALLSGKERSMWELTPQALEQDTGEPAGCDPRLGECLRLPVLTALQTVRRVSQSRTGLSPFARDCAPDPLVQRPTILGDRRFCFATNTLPPRRDTFLTAVECCKSQRRFVEFLSDAHADAGKPSLTGQVHSLLLPLKVFFLLVLLIVGFLLAVRRRSVDTHYEELAGRIERGVLVGAFAMLFWPVMNHAFLQSAAVLYGKSGGSVFRFLGPGFSIAFGAWGLLLLFFFYRRYEKSLEAVGKIAGVVASAVAILKYDTIVDYFVRFAGSGATVVTMAVLGFIGVLALIQLFVGFGGDPKSEAGAGARARVATAAAAAAAVAAGVHEGSESVESVVDPFKQGGSLGDGG